jgi:hypothetical protein
VPLDFPTLLGSVVFIGKSVFGLGLDFQRMCLRPMGGTDQGIMRILGAPQTGRTFCNVVSNACHLACIKNVGRATCIRETLCGTINEAAQILQVGSSNSSTHH